MTGIAQRVDDAIIKLADNDFRDHLGASVIGRKCDRAIWFGFRWATQSNFEPRILRLFARGHREEPSLEGYLRDAGLAVFPLDAETGKQFRINDHGQHFGGSMDGIGFGADEYIEEYFLLEYKTSGEKPFKVMQQKGVALAKPEHYAQMQVYMHKAAYDLPVALYIMVNKNTDELYFEWVPYNSEAGEHFITRAGNIIASTEPPIRINESPSWYECKFCDHYNLCQLGNTTPDVNCRTCAHSTPVIDDELPPQEDGTGLWTCELHDCAITSIEQRDGCEQHQFHPLMLDRTFTYEGGADYTNVAGVRFTNDAKHTPSVDMGLLV